MADEIPILPAHIEDTIRAIAKLHADHREEAGSLQQLVERLTAWIGRPQFIAALTVFIGLWIVGNVGMLVSGKAPWDEPPFAWLQGALGLLALYVTILILTTQRREDELASYREQLTLELAILSEQKSAKIIALLEEMRRDSPALKNRVDEEAAAMAVAADPQAVLDAIKDSEDLPLAAEMLPQWTPKWIHLLLWRSGLPDLIGLARDRKGRWLPQTDDHNRVLTIAPCQPSYWPRIAKHQQVRFGPVPQASFRR